MKFTSFYVENFCSPSRGALLTGSYAHRIGITRVFWPDSDDGLNPKEITIAELLKDKGYATATIGKWHLGHRKPFLPTNQGFDYYFISGSLSATIWGLMPGPPKVLMIHCRSCGTKK